MAARKGTLAVTGDADADKLLNTDPLALVIGMLLDQQVPMEWAFSSPLKLRDRLGGTLDAAALAAMPVEDLEVVFKGPPALHRYPGSMAKRTHALAEHLVAHHHGDAADVWAGAADAADAFRRIKALPGFGEEKSKIFLALLGKRFGRAPAGWESHAGVFGDDTPRSVADIDSAETLARVREWKQARKAEGKTKADK
ncbi:MAG: HhH-GPD-type base excision DNA repair protein [Acidimicrobiia bacterium]